MITGKYQFFHDQMPAGELRVFYTRALEAAQQRRSSFEVPAGVINSGACSLSNALLYMYGDHPELIDLNFLLCQAVPVSGGRYRIGLEYCAGGELAQRRQEELERTVEQVLKTCFPDGWEHLSPLSREKILFNYLADHAEYDHEAVKRSKEDPVRAVRESDAWSAYGALVKKKAVCQGIALAFKLLCDQVDLPSLVVIGRVLKNNERHAWNMVRIDGRFYHVDCTWMLRTEIDTRIPFCRYSYFNVPDPLFADRRSVEMDYLPQCHSLRHNPFYIRGLCVRSEKDAAEKLLQLIEEGNERFAVLCVGFQLTWDECSLMMETVCGRSGRRVTWYLNGHFLGGYTA